jgi:hypothetical protein
MSWSHHGRVHSEAAFAALAGISPVPASSGRTVRHRLNRGGDRTLNSAIHTIAKSRRRYHQPTKDYITRRTAEGRTPREIIRVLKRYIARHIWRTIQANSWQQPSQILVDCCLTGASTPRRHRPPAPTVTSTVTME